MALPSSPKQQLASVLIPSFKYDNFYYNHFSSRLLSKPHSHAIHTTLRNNTISCLLHQEKDYVKINYSNLFAADQRLMMTNSSVGSCTDSTPGQRRNVVDLLSRILASLLSYGVAFSFITMAAFLYTSNSALATSYGSMGGSSSSSSYSSDDDDYYYESSANKTCTCDTSCTQCIACDIKKEGYKQEKRYDNSCSCQCHSHCFFHKEIDFVFEFIRAISCAIIPMILIIKEATKSFADPTGTMLIFQVY